MNIRRTSVLLATIAVALTACSSTSTSGSSTAPSVAADVSTPVGSESTAAPEPSTPATTAAPTTSAAPAPLPPVTTAAPAPTPSTVAPAPPAPAPVVLRGMGLADLDFGRPTADVVTGLDARLTRASDISTAYPDFDGYARYTTADGGRAFSLPFGRVVCWSDGAGDQLCASFGGFTAADLTFVGWTYGGHVLLAEGGFTGGSRWADFPEIFSPGTAGCFDYTLSSVGGINLGLLSSGAPFGTYDESGTFVGPDPAPADVSILSMDAGQTPGDAEGDC